ncbi:serine/threonine phosphatase [Leptolyngbya sp. FACHB-36]|uniref:serine/threonine phosphatase n=1 Tax=Leptolyngbya sp. FACHB-36 TaxID=2692808 RepID=UPI0016807D81|nr:serine/threonine phosphatase [Leptolyngbya sp. FACHB-36]MBD2021211.1 serine/threonine phosphatase [Leptolyngbya sp. FACHB-36]
MLVCPHCRFENPNTNKFCQECGTSLTQNSCPECSSPVPFSSLECPTCGAIAGVVWWAIITDKLKGSSAASQPEPVAPDAGDGTAPAIFLDAQHRYQLLDPLPPPDAITHEQQVRVLDCNPLQRSPLAALTHEELNASSDSTPAGTTAATVGVSSVTLVVPTIAEPYRALGNQFYQTIPFIHDAWQQDGEQIVLLEDRSDFPLLIDLWLDERLSLPPLQILHWLYEIAELWEALEPWRCLKSVLEIENLRVDEDQSLCLQRLYPDLTATTPTLSELGQLWQTLFTQTQRTQFGDLSRLLTELATGKVETAEDLRSRIEAIAYELQTGQATVPLSPPPADIPVASDGPITNPPIELKNATSAAPTAATQLNLPLNQLVTLIEDEGEPDNDPTIVLPMQLANLEDLGWTDIGRQRQHNEDYFGIETQVAKLESPMGKTLHARNLYILCDGMGGQADGEVASALAVDTLRTYFRSVWMAGADITTKLPGPDVLNEAVQLANKAIYDINQQNARSGSGRMGTTLVLVLLQGTEVAVAHVGDSRLYRYTRKRGLEQLTIDHEVGQREIQRGVEPDIAYARPDAYQLTQALGPRDEHFVKPDIQYLELNEDTLLFLCSDGLTDNDLLETHFQTHVEPLLSSQTNLEQGIGRLIELANQYNGHDNITTIAIRAKVRPNLERLK